MERIRPPQELTAAVDFTVNRLCEGCPLRRPDLEGFKPAYGVVIVTDPQSTQLEVVNFEAQWNTIRGNSVALQQPIQAVDLSIGGVDIAAAKQQFKECEAPVVMPRRFRSDEIICRALNQILTERVPTRKNLKLHPVR